MMWSRKAGIVLLTLKQAFKEKKEAKRFVVLSGKHDTALFEDYDRAQIEQKYGGYVPNISHFWYVTL